MDHGALQLWEECKRETLERWHRGDDGPEYQQAAELFDKPLEED
ncbi:MAG: hypothetical protein RBR35_17825 [Salinivirgaceae bacterium]|nr:hypothetical protein [Salinivirgaceae bacterium]